MLPGDVLGRLRPAGLLGVPLEITKAVLIVALGVGGEVAAGNKVG